MIWLYRTGAKLLVPAACLAFAASAFAACAGPQNLLAQLRAHPTTDNAVLLGSWYASHRQFPCAVQTFRDGLKREPQSAQLRYLEGLALLGSERKAEAIGALREATRLEPGVMKPHLLLASLYDESGKLAEGEEQWRAALAIDPKAIPALEGLSANLLVRKDYAAVIALLGPAPRTERLAINLSKALGILDYLEEASRVLNEAIKLNPHSIDLSEALTVVLVKMRHYDEAIAVVHDEAKDHPDNLDVQLSLLRILVLTNHFDPARPLVPKLLAARPHDSEVLYLVGIVNRAVGDNDKAKQYLEQSVAINPEFFNSQYNLGMVLVIRREFAEAKQHLEKAIELDTPVPEVHFELAKALKGLGDSEGATREMKVYQKLKKDDETALEAASAAAQGDKEIEDGKPQEAIRHYREAADGAPNNAVYKYKVSIALKAAGDLPAEKAALQEALTLDPKLAGAHNELGYLLSKDGDVEGAIQQFRMAVDSAPAWTDAWINLAAELATGTHFSEARRAVGKALALDPGNEQAKELRDQLERDPAAKKELP